MMAGGGVRGGLVLLVLVSVRVGRGALALRLRFGTGRGRGAHVVVICGGAFPLGHLVLGQVFGVDARAKRPGQEALNLLLVSAGQFVFVFHRSAVHRQPDGNGVPLVQDVRRPGRYPLLVHHHTIYTLWNSHAKRGRMRVDRYIPHTCSDTTSSLITLAMREILAILSVTVH